MCGIGANDSKKHGLSLLVLDPRGYYLLRRGIGRALNLTHEEENTRWMKILHVVFKYWICPEACRKRWRGIPPPPHHLIS